MFIEAIQFFQSKKGINIVLHGNNQYMHIELPSLSNPIIYARNA